MSDLSKLRARWIRLEKRIAKLHGQFAEEWLSDEERGELNDQITDYVAKLDEVKALTHAEELRLFQPDAKLRMSDLKFS